jgi:hypothetical protein
LWQVQKGHCSNNFPFKRVTVRFGFCFKRKGNEKKVVSTRNTSICLSLLLKETMKIEFETSLFEKKSFNILCERGISKISTTFEISSLEFTPPPKNILFVDDVDASPQRG